MPDAFAVLKPRALTTRCRSETGVPITLVQSGPSCQSILNQAVGAVARRPRFFSFRASRRTLLMAGLPQWR